MTAPLDQLAAARALCEYPLSIATREEFDSDDLLRLRDLVAALLPQLLAAVEQLQRERDEAVQSRAIMLRVYNATTDEERTEQDLRMEIERLRSERDEARAELSLLVTTRRDEQRLRAEVNAWMDAEAKAGSLRTNGECPSWESYIAAAGAWHAAVHDLDERLARERASVEGGNG